MWRMVTSIYNTFFKKKIIFIEPSPSKESMLGEFVVCVWVIFYANGVLYVMIAIKNTNGFMSEGADNHNSSCE